MSLMSTFSFLWRTGSSAECDWGWLQGHNERSHPSFFSRDQHPARCSAKRKSTITAVSWTTLLHIHLPLEKGNIQKPNIAECCWGRVVLPFAGMLYLKGDTAAFISAPGTSLPTSESERMPQERIFFFLLLLWFKQCHSWRRAEQLIPLSTAIMHGCILCAVSPSQSHCAQSFRALFPYSFLLAEMHTTAFPRSRFVPSNLKSNYFLLAFLVSIFPSVFHLISLWILFHREAESDQMSFAFWFEVDEFIVILRPSQDF